MTTQIGSNSFFLGTYVESPIATAEAAKPLLEQFLADLAADKFDQEDPSFNGYQLYLERVIRDPGVHPAFPPYPKFKSDPTASGENNVGKVDSEGNQ
jgi:hypothetical protein